MTIFSLLRSPKTPRGNFLEKGQKIAYFMMNFKTLKTGYTPVNEVDTNDFLHEIASQKSLRQNKIRTFWEAIIVLELAHLCIAFLAYSAYLWHSHSPTLTSTDLDKCNSPIPKPHLTKLCTNLERLPTFKLQHHKILQRKWRPHEIHP